ncbi:hypothetical protein [Paenibacillus kribbensis]|uniref:hypothetical protein n=1 Tax=Paenibacillus kribbensis TaxID=172713 RepID=UPI00159EF962|nr:hypothetical protein [Paenibacillus kribbensis]
MSIEEDELGELNEGSNSFTSLIRLQVTGPTRNGSDKPPEGVSRNNRNWGKWKRGYPHGVHIRKDSPYIFY